MAIVEAASVGLTVVSTRVGGVPEVRQAETAPQSATGIQTRAQHCCQMHTSHSNWPPYDYNRSGKHLGHTSVPAPCPLRCSQMT